VKHSLEHFLCEAHRCVPHLSAEERRAWAQRCHAEHPGVTEQHITVPLEDRQKTEDRSASGPRPSDFCLLTSDFTRRRWSFRAVALVALLFCAAREVRCQDAAGFNGGLDPAFRNVPLVWVVNAPNGSCSGVSIEYAFSASPPALYGCNQSTLTWGQISGSGGGGSGCNPTGGAGVVQASNGAGACQNTSATDNGTTFKVREPLVSTGTLPGIGSGQGVLGGSSIDGGLLAGEGSTNDLTLANGAGTAVCTVATGTTTLNCTGLQVSGAPVLTGNQSITLSGDVSGTGATAISVSVTELHGNTLTNGDWCTTNGTIVNCTVAPVTDDSQLSNGSGYITLASLHGTAPINYSSGTISLAGAAGEVLAGSPAAFTATPTLGAAGTTTGTLSLAGSGSGTATITPQAAAGTPTLTLPDTSGTFAVNASGPLALNTTTGNLTCGSCLVNNSTNTGTAAMTLNMSASTGSNAFELPAQAGLACSAAGCLGEDTTAAMYHTYTGGADSLTVTVPASTSITNGYCAQWVVSGSLKTLGQASGACGTSSGGSGTVNSGTQGQLAYYAAAGTAVSGAGPCTARQLVLSNGASGPQCSDFPDVKIAPAAVCNAGAAGPGWTLPASGGFTPACAPNLLGALQGTPSSGATAYFDFELPGDWDTGSEPYINVFYGSGANTTGTVIFTISTACMGAEGGGTTDDPAFNANSAFSTQTMAAANRAWAVSGQLTTVTSSNACDAGSNMIVKVVLSGTASSAINVYKASITTPRLVTVQAN
jgi:hypothetical protein